MTATPASPPASQPTRDGWRGLLSQHALALLALSAVGLAFYTAVDYGNMLAQDDWSILYGVSVGQIGYNRPLSMLLLGLAYPLAGVNFAAYHVLTIAVRVVCAFLLYLLVRQWMRGEPVFAFVCGAFYLLYIVEDFFLLFNFIYTNDHWASTLFVLLALNAYAAATRSTPLRLPVRAALAAAALALGFVTPRIREAAVPLLLVIPAVMLLVEFGAARLQQRRFARWRIAALAAWLAAVLAGASGVILSVLGLGGPTYASDLASGFNPLRLAADTAWQLNFAFRQFALLELSQVYPYRLPVLLTLAATLLAVAVVRRHFPAEPAPELRRDVPRFLLAGAVGALATWLGFASYLVSEAARHSWRTHVLSLIGEGVLVASAIWLASVFVRQQSWRWAVRALGIGLVVVYGTAMAARMQAAINSLGGMWENSAYFMRTLAHFAPAVEEDTLFMHIENFELGEAPFISGFSFQYAIRYFYQDAAVGIIPTDNIIGEWEARDEGIWVNEGGRERVYGWDSVIFITREDSGRLIIMEELPPDFYTPARQRAYDPARPLRPGFIPERIRRAFPLVAAPEW